MTVERFTSVGQNNSLEEAVKTRGNSKFSFSGSPEANEGNNIVVEVTYSNGEYSFSLNTIVNKKSYTSKEKLLEVLKTGLDIFGFQEKQILDGDVTKDINFENSTDFETPVTEVVTNRTNDLDTYEFIFGSEARKEMEKEIESQNQKSVEQKEQKFREQKAIQLLSDKVFTLGITMKDLIFLVKT